MRLNPAWPPCHARSEAGILKEPSTKETARRNASGHAEVIAGKSVPAFQPAQVEDQQRGKTFAFIPTHNRKPRQRLFEPPKREGRERR